MTQNEQVWNMINENGSITTMEAYAEGITRLASRVHDLRRMGYPIKAETVYAKNRHGKSIHFARYTKAV